MRYLPPDVAILGGWIGGQTEDRRERDHRRGNQVSIAHPLLLQARRIARERPGLQLHAERQIAWIRGPGDGLRTVVPYRNAVHHGEFELLVVLEDSESVVVGRGTE